MSRKEEQIAALSLEQVREMQELLGDSSVEAKKAFLELYAWIPECAPQEVLDSYRANGAKEGKVPPFFSEVFSYEVLGKDQARTLRALIHNLGEALGLTRQEMDKEMSYTVGDEERPRVTKETPLGPDDFDALEMMMRENAVHFWTGRERVELQRALRALNATREVYAAPREEGWEFMQVHPKDLKVGDEIVRRGSWVQVIGFLHDDGKRWSEEGSKRSETPVGSKKKNYRGEPEDYLVLTNWSPKGGEHLQSRHKLTIRRRVG